MLKKVILGLVSLLFLSVFIFFTTAQISNPGTNSTIPGENQLVNKGSNFETYCTGANCITTFFSYDRYFNRDGEWEEIDENWHTCGNDFCTNDYYYNAVAGSNGRLEVSSHQGQFTQQMSSFANTSVTSLSLPIIDGSIITYPNVISNVDLRYQYLPHRLKGEIIIKQNISQHSLDAIFDLTGNSVSLDDPFICDNSGICKNLEYTFSGNQVSLTIPQSFLNRSGLVYPLVIDPSFVLGNSSIAWNGKVGYDFDDDAIGPFRFSNPTTLQLGRIPGNGAARGDIDWRFDLVNLSDVATIIGVNLTLFIESTNASNYINITHIEKNSSQWIDNQTENEQFYNDMANGTVYSNLNLLGSVANTSYNLSFNQQALNSLNSSLYGSKRFSTGLSTDLLVPIIISARDHPTPSQRPSLTINYGSASAAIAIGINNSLPNNPVSSNQKIYIVAENGQHFRGSFDKATIKNNQTWAFNFYNTGETTINMSSLLRIVNIWQNTSLSSVQITSQVENFINATKF